MSSAPVMPPVWSPQELERIDRAQELTIGAKLTDGSVRRPVPIWVVCVGEQVFVRTWYRRSTGWFGDVLKSRSARIRIADLEVDVAVEDVGECELRAGVDAAYRAKYGRYGSSSVDRMVTAEAAATTLRLIPSTAT